MVSWKRIQGFPDYEVSSSGGIRSFKGQKPRLLQPSITTEGYYTVVLYNGSRASGKNLFVHRLVALHFLPPPSQELKEECSKIKGGQVWVNHKDGDRLNNKEENLEWCTPSHNNTQTYVLGRVVPKGSENHRAKLSEALVKEMMEDYNKGGMTEREISAKYGVKRGTLASIRQGFTWNHVTGLPKKVQAPRKKTKCLSES